MVRYVVWFKDGYWYCADVSRMVTVCDQIKEFLPPYQASMPLLKSEGGAYYF